MLPRMTATQAKWSERVQAWRTSGKTAEEYPSAFEFQASTLRYWASRLKTESGEKPAVMACVVRRQSGAPVVERVETGAPSELEIAAGEARILVRRGFDAELLRQVVALSDWGARAARRRLPARDTKPPVKLEQQERRTSASRARNLSRVTGGDCRRR
jgi:hypothetical protein